MKTVIISGSIGYAGCSNEVEIQVDKTLTDKEVQEIAFGILMEEIVEWNWWWKDEKDS